MELIGNPNLRLKDKDAVTVFFPDGTNVVVFMHNNKPVIQMNTDTKSILHKISKKGEIKKV